MLQMDIMVMTKFRSDMARIRLVDVKKDFGAVPALRGST